MTDGARVALTFDAEHPDRPNSGDKTDAILSALAAADVRATFFMQGRWVEAVPDTARRIAGAGHLIGNHSHYHARMPLFSGHGLRTDVTTAEEIIRDEVGVDPRPWFRAPFGNGAERPELLDLLRALGYRHVGWHVSAEEWQSGQTAAAVADAVVEGVRAHGDGAIVLLHTWPDPMREGLPAAIERLAADGVRFVAVDELDLPQGLASIGEPQPGALTPPVGAG
jgi:peptidoglycan/xylan/chitin deacetylase (PgdA/CDA1 family)